VTITAFSKQGVEITPLTIVSGNVMTHLINIGCEKECKVMKKISQLIGNKLAKGG